MTVFVRLLDVAPDLKASELRKAASGDSRRVFDVNSTTFKQVPGSPFAYWVSEQLRATFASYPRFDQSHFSVRGAYTTDDFRFYRLAWEVPSSAISRTGQETDAGRPFVLLAKGGAFSRFYADIYLVVWWASSGMQAKAFLSSYRERKGWGNDWSACLNGHDSYFRPGLTWPLRTQSGLGLRVMPAGCVFGHKGPAAFAEKDEPDELLALLAITSSAVFRYLVELQIAFGSYEVGVIQRTPVPKWSVADREALAAFARQAWSLKRRLDTTTETSHAFVLPPGLNEPLTGLHRAQIQSSLAAIQSEIDDRAFNLYGVGPEDRASIEAWAKDGRTAETHTGESREADLSDDDVSEDADLAGAPADAPLSWLVGVAFGRFDERLGTGERSIPTEPEPFDPLPAQSPGMWPEGEPRDASRPDVFVDDPGHANDLRARVASAGARVGLPEPEHLRAWLSGEFFQLHIKMYSRSRRKAPIYWQLATPSASYSVWLYLHALTPDTLYTVQRDYVAPKLVHEEGKLEVMRAEYAATSRASDRKAVEAQELFVDELRDFLDEVKRVAPLWLPHLDDGVVINSAPLWRLFPHCKSWQKELAVSWQELCDGEYNWSHMAMHLWPERVVAKCADDRSIAIAHGLDGVFWVEETNGKWKRREKPTTPVSELVKARTSPAVKEALADLLAARGTGSARSRGAVGKRSSRRSKGGEG